MLKKNNGQLGGKKLGVREKNEKGERRKEEYYTKKGGKTLKNAVGRDFALPAANLFVGKKIESQKRGGGNDQNAQNIFLHL